MADLGKTNNDYFLNGQKLLNQERIKSTSYIYEEMC